MIHKINISISSVKPNDAAQSLAGLPHAVFDDLVKALILSGEDTALGIVFARANISANPDRIDDNETLLETIRRARA